MNKQIALEYMNERLTNRNNPNQISQEDVDFMTLYSEYAGDKSPADKVKQVLMTTGTVYIDKAINKLVKDFDIKVDTDPMLMQWAVGRNNVGNRVLKYR